VRHNNPVVVDEEYLSALSRYSAEHNEAISLTSHDDFLQNHTLEDEFVKVQIDTKESSPTFGTVLSMQMKFPNLEKPDQPFYSSNLMNPGNKLLWEANITLLNSTDGSQRLVKFENDKYVKSKSVESLANN
jgi:hypothetical protein